MYSEVLVITFPGNEEYAMDACERFFVVGELVSLFLHQADTLSLLNCQRVCRLWKEIIAQSQTLQEFLFLAPLKQPTGVQQAVNLNPVLEACFNPLFAFRTPLAFASGNKIGLQTAMCNYDDLANLPWARDGTTHDAPTRKAYSRREASWRKMLISQPPITHLDWGHLWKSDTGRGSHHLDYSEVITIGKLWDWLEALLLRGCDAQLTIFPTGSTQRDEPFSGREEQDCVRHTRSSNAPFKPDTPRIRLMSHQTWPGEGPSVYERFNVQEREWEVSDALSFKPTVRQLRVYQWKDCDGFWWLLVDCRRESSGDASSWRWSKSDAFQFVEMRSIDGVRHSQNRRPFQLRVTPAQDSVAEDEPS